LEEITEASGLDLVPCYAALVRWLKLLRKTTHRRAQSLYEDDLDLIQTRIDFSWVDFLFLFYLLGRVGLYTHGQRRKYLYIRTNTINSVLSMYIASRLLGGARVARTRFEDLHSCRLIRRGADVVGSCGPHSLWVYICRIDWSTLFSTPVHAVWGRRCIGVCPRGAWRGFCEEEGDLY
jgi:hypothetical protein